MFEIAQKTPRQHFEGTVQPAQAKLKLALQECQVVFILMTHLNLNESLTSCQTKANANLPYLPLHCHQPPMVGLDKNKIHMLN
jgi:hypothetical protein